MKKQINLLRGWPNPSLLPTQLIANASQKALSNPEISIPGLLYGPDPGYEPLREEIAGWMGRFYGAGKAAADEGEFYFYFLCIFLLTVGFFCVK